MKQVLTLVLPLLFIHAISAQNSASKKAYAGRIPFAGTYLSIESDAAHILQLSADGTMTFIMSWQFDNEGVIGESYSNTKGNWKENSPFSITAGTVDIAYKDGAFIGVARANYDIRFKENFRIAEMTCSGALYGPGINPLDENARAISGSAFDCPEPMRFERLPTE